MANPRIKELPPIVGINGTMIMPIYDYVSDATYYVTLANLLPTNTTSGGTGSKWGNTTSFDSGELAEYGGVIWESQIDGNVGNVPMAGSPYWLQVSVVTGMLLPWQAGAYVNDNQMVVNTINGVTNIYMLNTAAPFNSSDFNTELAAGKWVMVGQSLIISSVSGNALVFTAFDMQFQLGTLSADTTLTFTNATGGRFQCAFTITAPIKLTLPNTTSSRDGRWQQDAAYTLTILDLGDYVLEGTFNTHTNKWTLTLN